MWRGILFYGLCCSVAAGLLGFSPTLVLAGPDAYETAAQLDRLLGGGAAGDANQAAARSDDATFLRRVFLDLVGAPPTPDDVLAFTLDSDPHKRRAIVDVLLADEDFGANWAHYWRDVILYRRTEERALVTVQALTDYLTEQFNANTPWNEIATAFITATGDVRQNGNAALIMAQAGQPEDVTAEVSRIFLGIQIQCAQCHDHPTDRWKRQQFHELAAFFPRIAVRPDRSGDVPTFVVNVNDRPFTPRRRNNNNRFIGTPEHFMPDLDDPSAPGTRVEPVFFVNGNRLPLGTRDADRRRTLADWVTDPANPWFAKALVNRVWSELVGEGFYEPVDDLGPDRECAAPAALDHLATAFTDSGYDVKWLYRAVMATQTYQRQSRSRRDYDQEPFQANCLQRLRGDQLFESLVATLDLEDRLSRLPGRGGPYGQRNTPRALFNLSFGYDPSDPREEIGGSIQQALALMNSPFINQAITARRPDGLGELLRNHGDNQDALVELYLKTLARAPSASETRTCLSYIRQVGDRQEAFEDILWALINSTEFVHRN